MMDSHEKLTAPCGLYCGGCPLYLASKDEKMAEAIAQKFSIPIEAASCIGCRPAQGTPTPCKGTKCATYSCAEAKGHFTCVECDDFPCTKLAPAADKAGVVPHNTKIYNLLLIKRDGLEAWIENVAALQNQYYRGTLVYGVGPVISE
jgi:Protein of unknown function (DUF3795)